MRVTLAMQTGRNAEYLREAAEKLMDAQQTLTTGKKISRVSQDPTLAGRAMSFESTVRGLDQLIENNMLARTTLASTEAALGSMGDEVQLLRQVAVQAGDMPLSAEAKQALLAKIGGIRERLLDLADTRYLGKHLFSGTMTDTTPIAASPGDPPYIYQGNTDAVMLQVQPNLKIQTNVTADRVFNLDGSAGAGIDDIFSVMQDLETAINTGNVQASSELISQIDGNLANVLAIRSEVGAREQRLEDNDTALKDWKGRVSELLSSLEDADMTQAVIQLQTQQNVYQAALATASKIGQVSLVDYMD